MLATRSALLCRWEAYSRETFEYLLTGPGSSFISRRPRRPDQWLVFVIGLVEPDHTGHITTVAWRRIIAGGDWQSVLWQKWRKASGSGNVRIVRLEVRSLNIAAQKLYESLGYAITQRLPKYYSNGGDGIVDAQVARLARI